MWIDVSHLCNGSYNLMKAKSNGMSELEDLTMVWSVSSPAQYTAIHRFSLNAYNYNCSWYRSEQNPFLENRLYSNRRSNRAVNPSFVWIRNVCHYGIWYTDNKKIPDENEGYTIQYIESDNSNIISFSHQSQWRPLEKTTKQLSLLHSASRLLAVALRII